MFTGACNGRSVREGGHHSSPGHHRAETPHNAARPPNSLFSPLAQIGGFQGRVNKVADTCYSFWVGGTLTLLGELPLASAEDATAFVSSCEKKYTGGFSKTAEDEHPDILHSFYSLCWFSLIGERGLRSLDPALAICRE